MPPRSAGKEALLLTRRRHSKPQPEETLGQFCPRVFPQNRHFSQKSALKVSEIHALLWAYRGPRERKDEASSHDMSAHMPRWAHTGSSTLPTRKQLPIYDESSHMRTHVYSPPVLRKVVTLTTWAELREVSYSSFQVTHRCERRFFSSRSSLEVITSTIKYRRLPTYMSWSPTCKQ